MSLLSQGTLGKTRISGYLKGNGESALGLFPTPPTLVCFLSPPPLPTLLLFLIVECELGMWWEVPKKNLTSWQFYPVSVCFLDYFISFLGMLTLVTVLKYHCLFMSQLHASFKKIVENTINANKNATNCVKVCLQKTLCVIKE